MKKNLLVFALAIFCSLFSSVLYAQSWKWAVRGGSSSDGLNEFPHESVVDMVTDSHGNVYVLAEMESSFSPTLGDTVLSGFGDRDVLFTSYSCDGRMRFHKVIGSYAADLPGALRVDNTDHIYVTSRITAQSPEQTTFDTDTTLPASNQKTIFLACYDSTGHLDWLRMPTPDTASLFTNWTNRTYEIMVGKDGNIYWLAYLLPGLLAEPGSFVVDTPGPYILKYSPSGTLLQVIRPPLWWKSTLSDGYTNIRIHMVQELNGNVIFSGDVDYAGTTPSFYMGGVVQTQAAFLAEISLPDGYIAWQHHSDSAGFLGRPAIDEQGNLYLTGGGVDNATLAGYTIDNPMSLNITTLIVKLDSAGHFIWGSNGVDNALCTAAGITMKGSEVVVTGYYPGTLIWKGHTWANPPNTGFDLFMASFDRSTGDILTVDSAKSNVLADDYTTVITSDSRGNVFIGGNMMSMLTFGSVPPINSDGGTTDFFFARWGYSCDCIVPVAAFNTTSSGATGKTFTYNGTSPVDSVRWSFGDGSTGSGLSVSHTYTAVSTYTVCATAYTSCGLDDTCMTISTGLGVGGVPIGSPLHIYPDPAQLYIVVDGVAEGNIVLINAVGQIVARQSVTSTSLRMDVSGFPNGVYMLSCTDGEGERRSAKVVIAR